MLRGTLLYACEDNVASDPDETAAGDPGDPAARLLVRIGNFVEPLTRFGRSNISMAGSRHEIVTLMARQVFRVGFETQRSEGNGGLPPGVTEVSDGPALARETEGQLAASRATAATRLAEWAEAHGEDPMARPKAEDCFTLLPAVGHVEPCTSCSGSGRIACSVCHGERELTCERCKGRGSSACEICEASGSVVCQTCKGTGTATQQKEERIWDPVAGKERIKRSVESAPCPVCNTTGSVQCRRCDGTGQLTCPACQGAKKIPCTKCSGEGSETCQACAGQGRRHHLTSLVCTISETFEVAPRTNDPEIASVLKSRSDIAEILRLSSAHHATAELSSDTLRRDTITETPVTSASIMIGEERALIRGFGADQTVLDYRNIAGLLLAPDLLELGIANSSTQIMPPRASDELFSGLSKVLASEANVIVGAAQKAELGAVEERFRGVVTRDYINRSHDTVRKGLSRAYWVLLARGPAAALALPVLLAPVDVFLRGSGAGARATVLIFIIALTFALCLGGHFFVVHQLQKRLAPGGTPRIAPLLEKVGLTRAWFIGAGAVAVGLTLIIAALTNSVFPSPQGG
jgi:hypothetical protein